MAGGQATPVDDWKDVPADDWKDVQPTAAQPPTVPLGDQPVSFSGVARIMGKQAIEGAKGAVKGLAKSAYDAGSMAINPFGQNPVANYIDSKTGISDKVNRITSPSNTAQKVGGYIPDAAMMLAPGGVAEEAGKLIPSAERAGGNLEKIFKAVGNKPVNIDAAAPSALRAAELQRARFSTPPVMGRVLQRLSPGADPVGFREASDLATNAGKLSAAEKISIKGPMQGQVNALAKALRESNQAAADQAGVGDAYKQAINEYRRAKQLEGAKDTAVKIAKHAALPMAGAGLIGGAIREALR